MPELPEVECTRLSLAPLLGKKVECVFLSQKAPIKYSTTHKIKEIITGKDLHDINRKGKYLFFLFEDENELILHLGMSGKLVIEDKSSRHKHCHLELKFSEHLFLRFIDPRRFGILSHCQKDQWTNHPYSKNLAFDYLADEMHFSHFLKKCRRHPKTNLKSLCLNQSIASGLGNIYACESLYHAKLDPRRLVNDCTDLELKSLFFAAKKILNLGIKKGGTTLRDYVNGKGHRGDMKRFLKVYDRESLLSLDHKGKVEKIVQQNRSTFWVPTIQV